MASISSLLAIRHIRSAPHMHIIHYRGGRMTRSGRGLAYWFTPLSASVMEIPCNNRDQHFLFHGRSKDFQDVTAQGTVTYQITDPERMAPRVDFTIDSKSGVYRNTPLEQLSELLTQLAQQVTWDYMTKTELRTLLAEGVDEIRSRIRDALTSDPDLEAMGLTVTSVRVADIAPTPELEKALQAPARESIQQESDEAVFQRRALAVEKERAIAENELQNRIELAHRQEDLIAQEGLNHQREAQEFAEAEKIRSEAEADQERTRADAEATSIRMIQEAKVNAEARRMDIYRDTPTEVMLGLSARSLARNLKQIDHINLGGDSIGPLISNLLQIGIKRLDHDAVLHNGSDDLSTQVIDPPELDNDMTPDEEPDDTDEE